MEEEKKSFEELKEDIETKEAQPEEEISGKPLEEEVKRQIRVKKLPGGWSAGTGRRKTAVARVRLKPGTGTFLVNKKKYDEYFPRIQDRLEVLAPLEVTNMKGKVDIYVNVIGGGISGQAGAIKLGIARALVSEDPNLEPILRASGHLSRDSRMVERKKYGLHKARKATQFSKR